MVYSIKDNQFLLNMRIKANACTESIVGVLKDRLMIAINHSPIDGKANAALIDFTRNREGTGIIARIAITLLLCCITLKINADTVLLKHLNQQDSIVFTDVQTKEISPKYPGDSYAYPENPENILLASDNYNNVHYVILQPIFNSQPKVWILFKRDFDTIFPGYNDKDTLTEFYPNGDLYLSIVADISADDVNVMVSKKHEVISIDYSIFTKPVKMPTCYAIPENHKMRPCTTEEAELRTPALKVFLDEK